MRKPSTSRALLSTAVVAGALAAASSSAAAQEGAPILGFTSEHARAQQAYERAFTGGVRADVIANTSRALSRFRLTAAPGKPATFMINEEREATTEVALATINTEEIAIYAKLPIASPAVSRRSPLFVKACTSRTGDSPMRSSRSKHARAR